MTNIAKHYPEQEWEGNHIEGSRIYFFVIRSTISDDYLMKSELELIELKVGWGSQLMISHLSYLNDSIREVLDFI